MFISSGFLSILVQLQVLFKSSWRHCIVFYKL
nr:MAG TPA: hypothetical protein [Caudoviricetes sp.]